MNRYPRRRLLRRFAVLFALLLLVSHLYLVAQQSGGSGNDRGRTGTDAAPDAASPQNQKQPQQTPQISEEVVVTASGREETLGQISSTVQIINREQIEQSTAATVTDFLSENGIAFFSQWTPAQTSINLRGAATDGQGRDFRSQVVVLINGRRAGTANLSKLSLQEVYRIEILRGASSLIYGSQAIGGVINLITKDGVNSPGDFARVSGGSFGRVESVAQTGGTLGKFDYFVSAHGGRSGDYKSGGGGVESVMKNTGYKQYGGLLSLGYTISSSQRLEATLRSDGLYDAGYRGSSWDYDNYDNRYNQSLDVTYNGATASNRYAWTGRYYYFTDTDDLRWGSEVVKASNGRPAPGFDQDNNFRRNTGHGIKLSSTLGLFKTNNLLVGLDSEWSKLRNHRERLPMPGASTTQVAPQDNNSDSRNTGLFFEDEQQLFDGRLTLRGGARYDNGRHFIRATPNQPLLREMAAPYHDVTYRAGLSVRPASWLSLRGQVGTGYRAPTPSELVADFTTPLGGQILGNPNLKPERGTTYEVGALFERWGLFADLALFENDIRDRITTVAETGSRSRYVNRGISKITGLELQSRYELGSLRQQRFWLTANGVYHFRMKDFDAAARRLNTDNIDRMYKYQGSIALNVAGGKRWSAEVGGVLSGPIWYDTEENLLIPVGEPFSTFIHGKNPFWMFRANVHYRLNERFTIWAAVNNLFDVNQHPLFIALNQQPIIADTRFSNGGVGNSLPGRAFTIGIDFRRKRN